MIVPIRKMGDPILLQKSALITKEEFGSNELLNLIQDLIDTQHHHGGIGISAPQIGVSKQIAVIEYQQKNISRYSNIGDCPLRVIINPIIMPIGNEKSTFTEGCLSVPGLRGEVSRPAAISYQYYDQFGNLYKGGDSAFFARVIQHEYDHLNGILYPMRMQDISKLAFVDLI